MSDLFDYKKEMSELRFTEIQKKALAVGTPRIFPISAAW